MMETEMNRFTLSARITTPKHNHAFIMRPVSQRLRILFFLIEHCSWLTCFLSLNEVGQFLKIVATPLLHALSFVLFTLADIRIIKMHAKFFESSFTLTYVKKS